MKITIIDLLAQANLDTDVYIHAYFLEGEIKVVLDSESRTQHLELGLGWQQRSLGNTVVPLSMPELLRRSGNVYMHRVADYLGEKLARS